MQGKCQRCGREIEILAGRRYCEICSILKRKEIKLNYNNKNKEKIRQRQKEKRDKNKKPKFCCICNKELINPSNKQKYCSECRKIVAKTRDRTRIRKSEKKLKFCIVCGKELTKEKKYCASCFIERLKELNKKSRQRNKDKIKRYMDKYRKEKAEQIKKKGKEWRDKNKEKLKRQGKEYKLKHPEKVKKWKETEKKSGYHKKYNKKPEVKLRKLKWAKDNHSYEKYYLKHRKEHLQKNYKYIREKTKTDKEFAIKRRLRGLLRTALKVYTREGKIYNSKNYGVDYKAIIEYLKPNIPKDFLDSNKKYHIHHIKQLCTFKFINPDGTTNLEEVKKAFAPENHKIVTEEEHKKLHNHKTQEINQHYNKKFK